MCAVGWRQPASSRWPIRPVRGFGFAPADYQQGGYRIMCTRMSWRPSVDGGYLRGDGGGAFTGRLAGIKMATLRRGDGAGGAGTPSSRWSPAAWGKPDVGHPVGVDAAHPGAARALLFLYAGNTPRWHAFL